MAPSPMNRKAIILTLTTVAVLAAFAWRQTQTKAPANEPSPQGPAVAEMQQDDRTEATAESPIAHGAQPPKAAKKLVRFLELGSDSCASCKAMVPIIAELRSSYPTQLQVDFLDVWEFPEEAEPYAINLIPTQIFFDADGTELYRHVGFFPMEDILAKWKELEHPLTSNPSE